jgi:hypothetical protein
LKRVSFTIAAALHVMFHVVLEEISEREQFLNDMETLGRRKEYEHIILSEISQKVRELELIDKEKKL